MSRNRRVLLVSSLVVMLALLAAPAGWASAAPSIARIWNEQLLDSIRVDVPKPPVHARNLFHVSVAMWDAWAAYDPLATGYLVTEKHTADDVAAARAEAISYAVYRILKYRFPVGYVDDFGRPCHPNAAANQAAFDALMDELGYDKTNTSTVGDSPAALGNRIAAAVLAYGQTDGAYEGVGLCYPDDTGYYPQNPELIFKLPGNPNCIVPNNWQPLAFDYQVLQNGIIVGASVQSFVGVGWGDVLPFALSEADLPDTPPVNCLTTFGTPSPYLDPGCPPQLAGVGDATVKQAMLELIRFSSWTDPADGVMIDISPGTLGNNPLGTDDGGGHPENPFTGEPYEPNLVKRADWVRVVAQSWSDGPQSETPPGHWNVIANYVADQLQEGDHNGEANGHDKGNGEGHEKGAGQGHQFFDGEEKRIGGIGPVVDALEWDVKVYLALNGAVHDAAIGAWSAKHYYDSSRPITLIRYMGGLGQSSDPGGPSYHPDGLLLEPGLVEVITADTIAPGAKFEHLKSFCAGGGSNTNTGAPCESDADCPDDGPYDGYCESSLGKIAVLSWLGPPPSAPQTTTMGVGWRLATMWMTWFPATFVTPPFPGYTSGHSTFSRAGAEVLAAITGSPYFPGGIGTFDAEAFTYLFVEDGPSTDIQLQWATYFDAADEAGISRRFGGIHPLYDDFPARQMGSQVGQKAWVKAKTLYGPDTVDLCLPYGNAKHDKGKNLTVGREGLQEWLDKGATIGACATSTAADSRASGGSTKVVDDRASRRPVRQRSGR